MKLIYSIGVCQLIADGEWIGMNFEPEPDRANAQQIQDLQTQRR